MPEIGQILERLEADEQLRLKVISFTAGQVLIRQSDQRKMLWMVLAGELQLVKSTSGGGDVRMDKLGAGEMVGILSYYTGDPSFFGVEAVSEGRAWVLTWDDVESLRDSHPDISAFLQKRIRASITERYQRLVNLHMEIERVNQALQDEREELRHTIEELHKTRERLVHQEKLALIGSIVPGIAHELNNPAASLARNADYLESIMQQLLTDPAADQVATQLWQTGLSGYYVDTTAQRERMEQIQSQFPTLSRSIVRRLANIPPELLPVGQIREDVAKDWDQFLQPFEAAHYIHAVRSASHRISRLVQSLRRYSRPQSESGKPIQVAQGLKDTLLILNSRLRDVVVKVDFANVPNIMGNEDELNQVWTNLIVNAVEAIPPGGEIAVSCRADTASGEVVVCIADNGPGIPDAIRESIFEPSFTTKAKGGNFGMGLGLSISKVIIQKHGGSIVANNNTPGGACFEVRLPAIAA
jgi:signal transduction histidine kinase